MSSEQHFDQSDDAAEDPFASDTEQSDDVVNETGEDYEARGRVKFFNGHKGFGFIKAEDEEEYFVHISDVVENLELEDNMPVGFDTEQGDKGPKAVNVRILSDGSDLDLPEDVSDD